MTMDLSKLTLEIFSKLEQQWLTDCMSDNPLNSWSPPTKPNPSKIHILSIDGGFGPSGLASVASLVHLESLLQTLTSNPSARIPHFFHLVAGTGMGGLLAALLTASSDNSTPLLSASDAANLLFSSLPSLFRSSFLNRNRNRFSSKSFDRFLKNTFKDLTLRNACRPLLLPCYDVNTSNTFVFSRADAAGSDSFNFELWKAIRATAATPGLFKPHKLKSVDGKTECVGVDGGVVMNNPAAAAVTHVLHNKRDFPGVGGVEDLVVMSLGNGRGLDGSGEMMEVVMKGGSDVVDQMLANAFCWNPCDYLRIQANDLLTDETTKPKKKTALTAETLRKAGERMLEEKGVESLPFGGKRLLTETNAKRMEALVQRLVAPTSDATVTVVAPMLLLPPPSPPREDDAVAQLADGR